MGLEGKSGSKNIDNSGTARDGKIKRTRYQCFATGSGCLTFNNSGKNAPEGSRWAGVKIP